MKNEMKNKFNDDLNELSMERYAEIDEKVFEGYTTCKARAEKAGITFDSYAGFIGGMGFILEMLGAGKFGGKLPADLIAHKH